MLFIWLSIQRISTLYSPCITHTIRHRQPRRKTSKNYTKPNINGAEVAVAKSIKTVSIFTHEGNFFVSSREKKKRKQKANTFSLITLGIQSEYGIIIKHTAFENIIECVNRKTFPKVSNLTEILISKFVWLGLSGCYTITTLSTVNEVINVSNWTDSKANKRVIHCRIFSSDTDQPSHPDRKSSGMYESVVILIHSFFLRSIRFNLAYSLDKCYQIQINFN